MATALPGPQGAPAVQRPFRRPYERRRASGSSVVRLTRMCLIAILHPSSPAHGPPPTTRSPTDTPLGERFWCGRSRLPAAKAPRDTALKLAPEVVLLLHLAKVISSRRRSRNLPKPCFHHIANGSSAYLPFYLAPSLFRNQPNYL
jgi:hypothetical protein